MRVRNQSELRHFFFVRATIVGRDLFSMILENEERNKEGLGGGSEWQLLEFQSIKIWTLLPLLGRRCDNGLSHKVLAMKGVL